MADWDPALYGRFEGERTRPAADLLARVPLAAARSAVDLGCGPGNSTALLAARFGPEAVEGIDASEAMLASARARLPAVRFTRADIAGWTPAGSPDLVFANAALQWVPDHAALFPRLMGIVAPGGALAVQMPDNLAEPSHAAMRETALEGPWRGLVDVAAASRAGRMLDAGGYYDLLAPLASTVEVWRTTYHHPMASPEAIVSWVSGTGLRPFLDPLPGSLRPAFLAAYAARIERAYPARADGRRLLAFPRLFVVATRA